MTHKGKIAFVTGGSRGIGAAIVRRLVKDGATVVFTTSKSVDAAESLVKELGSATSYVVADSKDIASVRKAVKEAAAKHGKLDILVNNAGVFEAVGGDEELYRKQQAVNVDAVWAAVQEAHTVLADGGRIVSVGSVLGERAIMPGVAEYSATKAAVRMFTQAWALDFAPRNITVNAVAPGPIDTDMNPDNGGDFSEAQKSGVPLGRYGKPEDIAAAVAFLTSPEAGFITGVTLLVDGGIGAK
ncbi:MAG: SDR family oxidoreductase [Blastochloris viridis]|uniref:SDR family oxidoreductase n=1 Tax=Blastochloris viridis TaxID=1079 RepID=A0A6N4RCC5_BLAVI|nr:MAG: SDR family oxidoreductase [Blastochloris viridis]